jgi:peptide subunit release factor 1 (eRF1)
MGYSKRELKFYIKYLKKALKLIKKFEKSNYGLNLTYVKIGEQLQQDLDYYKDQLNRLKEDKSE